MRKLIVLLAFIPILVSAVTTQIDLFSYYQPFSGTGYVGPGFELTFPLYKEIINLDIGVRYWDIDSLRVRGHDFIKSSFGEANVFFFNSGLRVNISVKINPSLWARYS